MKKLAFLILCMLADTAQAQDYIQVCKAFNIPLQLKSLTDGNSLNLNLKIFEDYKTQVRLSGVDYQLLISERKKQRIIRLDTVNLISSSNIQLVFNRERKLVKTRNGITEEAYSYDSLGRLVGITSKMYGTGNSNRFVNQYAYDDLGRPIRVNSYSETAKTSKKSSAWLGTYDDQGRLIEEVSKKAGKPDWKTTFKWEHNRIANSQVYNEGFSKRKKLESKFIYENGILIRIDRFNSKNGRPMKSTRFVWTPL